MSLFQRLFRFAIVGTTTAVLYYALLYLGVEQLKISAVMSSAVVYLIVIAANYVMHYSWTFAANSPHTVALKRYVVMTGCGFIINVSVMYVGVPVLQLNYLLVQSVAMGLIVAWNFTLSSLWVFKE